MDVTTTPGITPVTMGMPSMPAIVVVIYAVVICAGL
jgi:hypothetical protein